MKKKILVLAMSIAVFSVSTTFAMENTEEPDRNPPAQLISPAPRLVNPPQPVNPAPLFGADGEIFRNTPSITKSTQYINGEWCDVYRDSMGNITFIEKFSDKKWKPIYNK